MPETMPISVFEAIKTKRAVREFQDRPVAREDILHILDAGRRAQSAMNKQAWQFVAMTDRDLLGAQRPSENGPH